ncbi:MAG: RHS repeat-associated core domain-containing protein, partial [Akkermansiaceae bacterium]|nr:RHS repeat-associated core domain-containing protein [Akkermansiaceae bacterium]
NLRLRSYGTLIGLAKKNQTTGLLESLITENFNLATSSYLFTGEQWDEDLGMYFLRARYLNTNTGRFHSQDTYEGNNTDPASLHKYLYGNGNPVSNIDPSGNLSLGEVGQVIGNLVNNISIRISFAATQTTVAFYWAFLRLGLVPIGSQLINFANRVTKPITNQIINSFASRPDLTFSISRWTNGIGGARAHFFNRATTDPNRFSIISERLQLPVFRWGPNGFKLFTEIADEISNLPLGPSAYGTVYRISNGGQTITFVRTTGSGSLKGNDIGVAVIKTGELIASFRDAVGDVIKTGAGIF